MYWVYGLHYLDNVKIVLMKCTFSQELFTVGSFKKKRAGGVQKETSRSLECANKWQYRSVCNKEKLRQERVSSLPAARVSRVKVTWLKASTLAEIQVGGHPPYSPDLSPCDYAIFGPLKRGFEGQTIHLGRRLQSVRAELVHNAALGILRDSHSPPCVAVGQVPQQPGPILLTYRYLFLLLGLRLVSFLMPLI